VRSRLLGGCVERRTFEDIFDDDEDVTVPSGFFDGAQGTLTEAAGWRDTAVVVRRPTAPLEKANFGPPAAADDVDEQLPLEEVRHLTRCGRAARLLDVEVVVVVRLEDGL